MPTQTGEETYNIIRAEIRRNLGDVEGLDTMSQVFAVADVVCSIIDGVTGFPSGVINSGIQGVLGGSMAYSNVPAPNPWFVANGLGDLNKSDYTRKYLRNRSIKGGAGAGISLAGTLAMGSTGGVNTGGAAVDLNALGSTGVHLIKLVAIAKRYKQTLTISEWCDAIVAAKCAKVGVRGGSLAGNLIPGGCIPLSISMAIVKTGIKLTMGNLCYATAAEVHWRAYREQAISGGLKKGTGGHVGPASRIFWEIFTKRGITRMFGNYDIAQLVKEPGGWQALGDKLLNI